MNFTDYCTGLPSQCSIFFRVFTTGFQVFFKCSFGQDVVKAYGNEQLSSSHSISDHRNDRNQLYDQPVVTKQLVGCTVEGAWR